MGWERRMLKYPENAIFGLLAINRHSNDVNVFVEDATSENYYRVFLPRLAGGDLRIQKVFQCSGRLGVIKAAQDDRLRRYEPTFFLIDGDLYLLSGEKYPIPPNVFVLDHYCLENLFVCPEGILRTAYESESNISLKQLAIRLGLKSWFRQLVVAFYPMFVWYAVAMRLGSQAKTVSINGLAYRKKNSSVVDRALVRRRIADLRKALIDEFGRSVVYGAYKTISDSSKHSKNKMRYISAKTYIFPMLARHMSTVCSFADEHGLVMRLAHNCSFASSERLKAALLTCLGRSDDRFGQQS
jgi:Protein of unknown function (DUF4435)